MNFSIIIPVYNENENILKLIEEITISINDYKDYEIIIIDDGSTDDSNIIINKIEYCPYHPEGKIKIYSLRFSRVKVIKILSS